MVAGVHKDMSISETEMTEHPIWKAWRKVKVLRSHIRSRDDIEKRYRNKREPYFRVIVDELVKEKLDHSGLSYTFAAIMLGFTCFHSDVTNRNIEFRHMSVELIAVPGVSDKSEVWMLGIDRVEDNVKSKTNDSNTSYVLRHKNPELCTVFAVAMQTFLKLRTIDHLKELNKEVRQRNQVPEREHMGELENNDRVTSRHLSGSYTSSYTKMKKSFVDNEQIMAATHAGIKSGVYYSLAKGCDEDEVSYHGGSEYRGMDADDIFDYQPRSSPGVLRVLAGFELSETYHVPRTHFKVPEYLKDRVFTCAKLQLAHTEHHRMKKVLDFFATVLLQDLPFIFEKYPTHALSFVEPFNSEEFRMYAQKVLESHEKEKEALANGSTDELEAMSQNVTRLESAVYSSDRQLDEPIANYSTGQNTQTDMHQLVELMHTLMDEKMANYRVDQRSILKESVDSLNDKLSKSTEEATRMLHLSLMRIRTLHDNLSRNVLPNIEAAAFDSENTAKKFTSSKVFKLMQKSCTASTSENIQSSLSTEETKDQDNDEMGVNDLGTPADDTSSTDDDTSNRVRRKHTGVDLATLKRVHRSNTLLNPSMEPEVPTSHRETVTIVFNINYREFLSDWLVGSIDLAGHPLIELKSAKYKNLRTSKILDPNLEETYKKYARVAKLFRSAFEEELMADSIEAVTLIGKTIACCISLAPKEDHLRRILASPSLTASFLKAFNDESGTLDTVPKRTEFLKKKILEAKTAVRT
jgi:type 1 fimbria pilin